MPRKNVFRNIAASIAAAMPRKNLVIIAAVLIAAALGMDRAFSSEDDRYYKEMEVFARIMHEVVNNYVTEPDQEKLFEGAYRGMLQQLDPYSQYFTETQNASFSEDTEGQFGGLGIEISLNDGILTVIAPMRGTPAYEAGILAGDTILEIDGQSTERITLEEAVRILRGEPGTQVTLTVRHPGAWVNSTITITREIIKAVSIEHEIIDRQSGIGYIRTSTFTAKIVDDMHEAVEAMQKDNLKGLILDLRQNPGGLLNMAVEMADEFLDEGTIVSVKGRRPEQTKTFRATRGEKLEEMPLVVLIDEGSASASEIVAGALRDHRRALLVGTRTYGKGSVQNIIPLAEGQAMKLTTARYYTPNDKPILDRQGIFPDVPVPMSREHLIALRNQEREDKLRGAYRLTGAIEEYNGVPEEPEAPAAEEENPQPPTEEEESGRRMRVVDYQLKSAYNILRWQLNGSTLLAESSVPQE